MAQSATLLALHLLLVIAHGNSLPISEAASKPGPTSAPEALGGAVHPGRGCSDEECLAAELARSAVAALADGGEGRLAALNFGPEGWSRGPDEGLEAAVYALGGEQALDEGRVAVIRGCPKCTPSDPGSCLACAMPTGKLFVVIAGEEQHPEAREQGVSWLCATPEATRHLGELLLQTVKEAAAAVEMLAGDFPLALEVDVNEELFAPAGPLGQAVGVFFVRGSRLVLNPRTVSALPRYLEDPAHLSSLLAHCSDLNATIAREETSEAGKSSESSPLVQLRRRLTASRLKELRSLSAIPFKCLACIVIMGTLVPIAVNVILQGLAVAYCQARSMSPEECDKIRFMMIGISIALMPFEVVPVAAACTTDHHCKDEPAL
mmetsp:Transcript_57531/g.141067  ORF Transcript_57531/g.141067 Transcript_57531/m.141067 type:complete len:377 (-) Transcript_57531:120-1250(-)